MERKGRIETILTEALGFLLAFLAFGCSAVAPGLSYNASQLQDNGEGEHEKVGRERERRGFRKGYAGTTSQADPFGEGPEKSEVLLRLAENVPFLEPVFDFVSSSKVESEDKSRSFGLEVFDGRPVLYLTVMF